jgi:hypothetical protein
MIWPDSGLSHESAQEFDAAMAIRHYLATMLVLSSSAVISGGDGR